MADLIAYLRALLSVADLAELLNTSSRTIHRVLPESLQSLNR
jgi:hypothetical protein